MVNSNAKHQAKHQDYKIALYVRVSTEEQAENPEGSIKNQEQRLREAVIYRNRNSSFGEIVGVYIVHRRSDTHFQYEILELN